MNRHHNGTTFSHREITEGAAGVACRLLDFGYSVSFAAGVAQQIRHSHNPAEALHDAETMADHLCHGRRRVRGRS
jgi:hypothetical protein